VSNFSTSVHKIIYRLKDGEKISSFEIFKYKVRRRMFFDKSQDILLLAVAILYYRESGICSEKVRLK